MIRYSIALMILHGAIFCGEGRDSKIQADQEVKLAVERGTGARALTVERVLKELNIPLVLVSAIKGYMAPPVFDCRFPVVGVGRKPLPWQNDCIGERADFWAYMYSNGSLHAWDILTISGRAPHSGLPDFPSAAAISRCPIDPEVWEVVLKTSQFSKATAVMCPCQSYSQAGYPDEVSPEQVRQDSMELAYATLLGAFIPSVIEIGSDEYERGISQSPYWHEPFLSPQAMLETFERIRKQAFARACDNCKSVPHLPCKLTIHSSGACQFVRGFAAAPKNSSNGEPLLLDAIRGIIPGERTVLFTISPGS